MKILTNTFKLTHRNEQNTSKTSQLSREEFHIPHAQSLHDFLSMTTQINGFPKKRKFKKS
jgi:hypothetical protein